MSRNTALDTKIEMSAQPCGCDPGAGWTCEFHRKTVEMVSDEEDMKVKDFEQFIYDRSIKGIPIDNMSYNVIGLGGECGEVLEWYKKGVIRGESKEFDDEHLLNELGDVQHYLTRIALSKGWTIKDVMKANVKKLKKRYGIKA